MLADAERREQILVALGELRSAVAEGRIEGVMSLFAPEPGHDADRLLREGEIARGPIELRGLLEELFAAPETYSWHREDVSVSLCGGSHGSGPRGG
jgi:hypothetical protein